VCKALPFAIILFKNNNNNNNKIKYFWKELKIMPANILYYWTEKNAITTALN